MKQRRLEVWQEKKELIEDRDRQKKERKKYREIREITKEEEENDWVGQRNLKNTS